MLERILLLSFLAGALHVLAPDHWLPASVMSWQRRWRAGSTALFSLTAYSFHVVLGLLIFFALEGFISSLQSTALLIFALVLVGTSTLIRLYRFTRIEEVLCAGPGSKRGIFAVFSLLGPCESLIPVLIKSGQMGVGYLTPFFVFLAGTLVSGTVLVFAGRRLWNRPMGLPMGMSWAYRSSAAIPLLACIVLGISVWVRA